MIWASISRTRPSRCLISPSMVSACSLSSGISESDNFSSSTAIFSSSVLLSSSFSSFWIATWSISARSSMRDSSISTRSAFFASTSLASLSPRPLISSSCISFLDISFSHSVISRLTSEMCPSKVSSFLIAELRLESNSVTCSAIFVSLSFSAAANDRVERPLDPPVIAPLFSTTSPSSVTIRMPPISFLALVRLSTISVSLNTYQNADSKRRSKSIRSIAYPITPSLFDRSL